MNRKLFIKMFNNELCASKVAQSLSLKLLLLLDPKASKLAPKLVSMLDLVQVLDQRQQQDNVEDTFFFILNYFATKKNPSLHDKPEVFCTTLFFSDTWISPLLLHFRLHTPPLPGCGPTSTTSQCPEICSRPRTRLMSS